MPSFFSLCATMKPGVPFSTRNDLIPPRPADLSIVAQTTTPSARQPVVTKIFSPFSTHSSPSSTALVCTRDGSEPQPGSVIAIASVSALPLRDLLGRARGAQRGVAEAAALAARMRTE